jgi:hypothetical protein
MRRFKSGPSYCTKMAEFHAPGGEIPGRQGRHGRKIPRKMKPLAAASE